MANTKKDVAMKFSVVDAFTSKPFMGNPAAVVVLGEGQVLGEDFMQSFASEMNLSETVYVRRLGPAEWNIRWFTPCCEEQLCGHATLAASHVLFEGPEGSADRITFTSLSGPLYVQRKGSAIAMDFPLEAPEIIDEVSTGFVESLGLRGADVVAVARNRLDCIVQVTSEETVANMEPDFNALKTFKEAVRVVAVTAKGTTTDVASRTFAPADGVNEDPVCGSAHCGLAPFWAQRQGKSRMSACQLSRRKGELTMEIVGDRVVLEGRAVTVIRGEYVAHMD